MKRSVQKQYLNNSKNILSEAKLKLKAIVMDQDGTVKGGRNPKYSEADVVRLVQKIAKAGIYPVIITASGASALKSLSSMNNFYTQKQYSTSTYISIGNGSALYRYNTGGRIKIYNRELTLDEEIAIIRIWENVYGTLGVKVKDLQQKGIETLKRFIMTDWTGYIPPKYVELFKQYGGRCFTEPVKVTVVFPVWEEERQRELVKQMQMKLDNQLGKNKYVAMRGDDTFLHINHSFNVDPKLFALRTVMKELSLHAKNIVALGDLPLDNDRGLLVESRLPYTFTNHEFGKHNLNKPPYILPDSAVSPVGSVYEAIDYLLS